MSWGDIAVGGVLAYLAIGAVLQWRLVYSSRFIPPPRRTAGDLVWAVAFWPLYVLAYIIW